MRVRQPEGGGRKYAQSLQNARNKPSQISAAPPHAIHTLIPRTLFLFWAEGLESHRRDPDAWLKFL